MMRGMQMLESGKNIVENADGSFAVPSQTGSKVYEVRLIQSTWVCTCPDFEFRGVEACKHIFAVRMQIAAKTYLKEEPKPKVFAEDAMPCDKCGSIRTMKYGTYGSKQMYFCKDCKHKFREPSVLKKVKFTPELITLTLDLYFSGLSLRKISRNVSDHFKVDVNYSTIYTWIQRYIPRISEYVNTLTPQLSKEWHADELFVRMRGSPHTGKYEGLAFVWNVMDRETRFLLASKVSESRDISGALTALQTAIKNAGGQVPEQIRTDKHNSYRQGVKWAFEDTGAKVEHIADCGVRKGKHTNNNRIERLNGTMRERVKVQRGLKSYQTTVTEGQRIYYNFVKPHIALGGQTPAKAAGLDSASGNKWMTMLRDASTKPLQKVI
jgi:putative transposase